jgi:hypothetical protein
MKITTVPLSKEDIKLLKSKNPMRYFIILFLMLLAFLIFYNIYYGDPDSPKQVYDWDNILGAVFGILFIGTFLFYTIYSIITTRKDVVVSQKEVLVGILTKKDDYYFYLGDEKMAISSVNSSMDNNGRYYEKIGEIVQKIILERSIYTKTILKIQVSNETE